MYDRHPANARQLFSQGGKFLTGKKRNSFMRPAFLPPEGDMREICKMATKKLFHMRNSSFGMYR